MKTIQVIISGKVQGVFFRATAKEMADKFSVKGWVKNTDNGDVEAMITGYESEIKNFIEWCKKGPEKATVSNVSTNEKALQYFKTFEIIRR